MYRQEAHGPHRSPEKQFQSINTFAQSYYYTIKLINRKQSLTLFWEFKWPSICKTWVPFTQECFVPSSVVLEKIFKFSQCIFAISLLSPLEFPSPKDAFCWVWLKLVQWFWKRWQCEKFTKRWTQTDNGQQAIKKLTHKQSLKVSLKIHLQIDIFYQLERKWEIDQRACCIFISNCKTPQKYACL